MSKENYKRQKCPVAKSLSVFGDQWTLLIVRDVLQGIDRFEGFQKSLGISRNLLTIRLKDMVESGLLTREIITGSRRYAYKPTEKCRDLRITLSALAGWGDRWSPGEGGARIELKDRHSNAPAGLGYYRKTDNVLLEPEDVVSQAGPGASADLVRRLARKS
ncbi:helix-turn-helix transcriptional regulator [Sneathiella marina]|uniref:Helix-turn-helix transcriptional regulator n=1 Tax=Sneathiella marina TaxID=2950108 RepID=A0ABY4W3N4_9PROT|nr:helix-turn-helix domain-containing protein [Sneathiella marina]USG61798.1 helix-turn-helix transcriptional regulator [Sneathiella marina]